MERLVSCATLDFNFFIRLHQIFTCANQQMELIIGMSAEYKFVVVFFFALNLSDCEPHLQQISGIYNKEGRKVRSTMHG